MASKNEVAQMLNISTQLLDKYMRKNDFRKKYTTKNENGRVQINETGVLKLREMVLKHDEESSINKGFNNETVLKTDENVLKLLNETIETLQKQLTIKDEQILQKDKQLEHAHEEKKELTKTLDQSQQLQQDIQRQLSLAQDKIKALELPNPEITEPESHKGFWDKFWGK